MQSDFSVAAVSSAGRSAQTVFITFCEEIRKHGDSVYCFVEGFDEPYYKPRVSILSNNQSVYFIQSYGKQYVIEFYELIQKKTEYGKYKKMFFVDSDYDDNRRLNPNIYRTPCYSVENFYINKSVIAGFTDHIIQLNEHDLDSAKASSDAAVKNKMLEFFSLKKDEWLNAISPFCAWYKCVKNSSINYGVKLGETFPSSYVEIQGEKKSFEIINKGYDLAKLNADFNTRVSQTDYDNALQYIQSNKDYYIRGKYILQFIERLLSFWVANSKLPRVEREFSLKAIDFNVNKKRLMSDLSAYAQSTSCLTTYVRGRI